MSLKILALPLLAGLLVASPLRIANADAVLAHGEFLRDDSERPPAGQAAWEPVELPHSWSDVEPGQRRDAWYRFTLPPIGNGASS